MNFHYCVVGKAGEPLASAGNKSYEQRVLQLLPKVNINKVRVDYEDDRVVHHALNDAGYSIICTTSPSVDKLRVYTLLQQIKEQLPLFSETQLASAWTLQTKMGPIMKSLLDDYEAGRETDGLSVLEHEVNETESIMVDNAKKAIERGGNLQDLMGEAEQLEATAFIYQNTTKEVKRKYWRKNIKLWMIFGIIIGICFLIFISVITSRKSKRRKLAAAAAQMRTISPTLILVDTTNSTVNSTSTTISSLILNILTSESTGGM